MSSTTTEMNVSKISPNQGERVNVLGITLEWKVTEAETTSGYSIVEAEVPPNAGVPLHRHPQSESFYVIEGTAEFGRIGPSGPEWLAVSPGDAVHIPGNAIHGFRNLSASTARVLITCAKGLEAFFREAGMPEARVQSGPPSPASIERVIQIMRKHGQELANP
jgi:quercetin dioxygenase-like cupin family protein